MSTSARTIIDDGARTNRARLLALLDEDATREYQAVLRLIRERQCDSLGDFAMAEHLRSVLMQQQGPRTLPTPPFGNLPSVVPS